MLKEELLKEVVDEEKGIITKYYTLNGKDVWYSVTQPLVSEPVEPQPTTDGRLEIIELSVAKTQTQVDYLAFMTELATMKGGEK